MNNWFWQVVLLAGVVIVMAGVAGVLRISWRRGKGINDL